MLLAQQSAILVQQCVSLFFRFPEACDSGATLPGHLFLLRPLPQVVEGGMWVEGGVQHTRRLHSHKEKNFRLPDS